MRLRGAPALALLLSALWLVRPGAVGAQALAQSPAPRAVVLDVRACASVALPTLRALVGMELAPRPLLSPDQVEPGAPVVRARVDCRGARALLHVEDEGRGQQELTLNLAETAAPAQTRLLALAISELVVSLELEAQSARTEPAASPAKQVAPPAPAAHKNEPARTRADAWVAAGLLRAGRPAALGFGVAVGAQYYLAGLPLALVADLGVGRAQRSVEDGRVRSWLLMGSLALTPSLRRSWIDAGLGAGLRLGHAWLDGSPGTDSAHLAAGEVSAFWWGPLLQSSARVPVGGHWGVRAAVDVTYLVKPVRGLSAAGDVAYALDRFVLLATLGASLGF